VRKVTLRYDTD